MWSWAPSIFSGLLFVLSQAGVPDMLSHWISANPGTALAYGSAYALVKGLLPSPVNLPK